MSDAKARHFKPHSRFPFVTSIWWCLNNSARERRKAYTRHHRYYHHDYHYHHHYHYYTTTCPTTTIFDRHRRHHRRHHPRLLPFSSFGTPARARNRPSPCVARAISSAARSSKLVDIPLFHSRQQERRYTLAFLAAGHPRDATPRPRDLDNATPVSGCH